MKFKKLLAFFLVFCILATSLFTTSVFANAEYDLEDVKELAQHLAGWDINVDEGTLDYNCDGRVNLKDLVLLAQFVAGWNVVIGNGSNSIIPDDAYTQSVSADVVPVDGKVPEGGVVLSNGSVSATVPEGVLLNAGATTITLKIAYLNNSAGGVVAGENEELVPVDVHIEGVSKANTVPIIINMGKVLPEGLNLGNYKFFHVEDGEAKVMTLVDSADALTAHNTFTYDANTGEVTVAMATFSPVIVVYDTTKVWNGGRDDSWYNKDATELTIANADQFYSFSIAVGLETVKNFEGKTVKLMADIDLNNRLFYPIGYYNNQKNTKRDRENIEGVAGVESSVRAFAGVFDGNGHTVKNFYQNTWEMLGDYNSGYSGTPNYYKDAMGLFGYVVNGTVKNLNVENFSSDGEFTPTGVIAAYSENSTFENIAITNCNPRVYNTGNGGIVGIGGDSSDSEASKLTFKNITIDNSNKITALWGSWDVACGGLIGMFRGPGKVDMINCHVAAQIDVFNDVCGNYQYYWYRYAGMLIGTNKNMITDANGYTVPETDKFYAENCTVHFGEWNNYYYCELVENSLASYTHDHQFSRLTEIKDISEINDGENWTTTGNFYLKDGEAVTCYHIRKNAEGNLYEHKHVDSGYETSIDEDNDGNVDLKEDKQVVYLPFNQLFTGYGWGVKHVPIYNNEEDNVFAGVKILDNHDGYSVDKFEFEADVTDSYKTGMTVSVGKLFKTVDDLAIPVMKDALRVFVSPADEYSTVSATFTPSATANWEDATITFSGTGIANITINDYYFCKPTTISVNITNVSDTEAYLNDYMNWNMFSAKDGELPGLDTNGNGTNSTLIEGVHDSSKTYPYLKMDNTYGRTDNTSVLVSSYLEYTYIKLPSLKPNTDYVFTFYFSGLEKSTYTTSDKNYERLLASYHLFTPIVDNASFSWQGDGCLYTSSYNYSYSFEDAIYKDPKTYPEVSNGSKYHTSSDTIIAGKDKWNKVEIKFNSKEFNEDLYFVFNNYCKTTAHLQRWIDDISLVEAKNWNNDASLWNEYNATGATAIAPLVDLGDKNGTTITTKNTWAKVKYLNYADAPEKLIKYPGVEDYIHLSNMGGGQAVTMCIDVEKNTKYKIHFNYLSPDGVSESSGNYYHLNNVAVIGVPENGTRPVLCTSSLTYKYNTLSLKTTGYGYSDANATKVDATCTTKIDLATQAQWQTMEIEFNSYDYSQVVLYITGGATVKTGTAARDIYLTNLEMTVID